MLTIHDNFIPANEISATPDINGQMFFRDTGKTHPRDDSKKVMFVVAIVSVPKDFSIKGEHMCRVMGQSGTNMQGEPKIELYIDGKGEAIDKKYEGWTAEDILMAPLWKL